jgi:hypothetical protein
MPTVFVQEAMKFEKNAGVELTNAGKLDSFFKSMGFVLEKYRNGFRTTCPSCRKSNAFVGVGGSTHYLYWRCFCSECSSYQMKYPKNLIGFVRAAKKCSMGEALKIVSDFLGVASPNDITNKKPAKPQPVQPPKVEATRPTDRIAEAAKASSEKLLPRPPYVSDYEKKRRTDLNELRKKFGMPPLD